MNIQKVAKEIQEKFGEPFDLIVREFLIAGKTPAIAVFIDTVAGGMRVGAEVILPLSMPNNWAVDSKQDLFERVVKTLNGNCRIEIIEDFDQVIFELTNGKTLILVEGIDKFLFADTTFFQDRGVSEPPTSAVVKGPREGFAENTVVNVGLLRKRLKTPDLVISNVIVGKYTRTNVSIMYIKSIADKKIVDDVTKKLESIEIDGIVDSHYILSFLQTDKMNVFRQAGNDEKPDIIAAKMLEGRVAILVDGSPIVLTVPYILLEDIQAVDDYYNANTVVTVRRFIRLVGGMLALILPGLYVAMQLYHYKIVPLNILTVITNSVENSPFSPMVEIIFILILFEIMYEASLRMPMHLGAATGLVGALVLGGTAVESGLTSAPAVLIAALSMITMYILPNLAPQISLLRLVFVLIAGVIGLYGLLIGAIILVVYLANLESFDTPILAPFAPRVKSDLKDGIIKSNVRDSMTRPASFPNKNKHKRKRKTKKEATS